MAITGLQRKVASIALEAGQPWGFAFAGAGALMEHRVIDRTTQDVDCFSNRAKAVNDCAAAVEAALHAAGLRAERVDKTEGLSDVFYGMGDDLAEWSVTGPGGEQAILQLAYFDRARSPVTMAIGPVLHIEDLLGGKAHAASTRAEPRDWADLFAALEKLSYSITQVIAFARRLAPDLMDEELQEAGDRLDRMPDDEFTVFGLTRRDAARLRARFAEWPRSSGGRA
jgi:hypothetical protein